jgi:hypothetical protein
LNRRDPRKLMRSPTPALIRLNPSSICNTINVE